MRITCIRHGLTDENARGVFRGRGGGGLTDEQTRALDALHFDSSGFDAIYSSPAPRCLETAACLGVASFVEDSRLSERDFGVFDGLTVAECEERYSAELAAFRALDEHFRIPDGESRADHLNRILAWISDIPASHAVVLAVTHGGTIDLLYRLGSGLERHGGKQVFAGPNAAMSVFTVVGGEVVQVVTHGERLVDTFGGQKGHVL